MAHKDDNGYGTHKKMAMKTMGMDYDTDPNLKYWNHKDAKKYAERLLHYYGKPTYISKTEVCWESPNEKIIDVKIKDESITHDFPMSHKDFVYATMKQKLTPEQVGELAKVTGSIMYDGLKGEVTARCGMMIKNGVSLGFVEDIASGKIQGDPKEEYGRRIKADEAPSWYVDKAYDMVKVN